MNQATIVGMSPEGYARAAKLQKRWQFCQRFAAQLYRSDLDDEALRSVAGSIAAAMRAREDAMLHRLDFTNDGESVIE